MRVPPSILTLLAAVSLVPVSLRANDIEPGKEFYTVIRAPSAITLDGNLSEWSGVPVLADPKFSIPKGSGSGGSYVLFEEYAGGTWTGPDDQTSAVQVVYDSENVYFGFVVTDDYHENAANSAWNGDSIQLMIASADRTAQVALYNYALGGIETALGTTIVMHEAGPGGTTAAVVRDTLNNKTTYEIKLPVASLGLTAPLAVGTQFGLGMAINDGDEATPGQKGWGGLGAHALVFGKSPGETALVTLGAGGSGAALFFLSAVNPAIDRFSFRASDLGTSIVDPSTAKLRVDGQQVLLVASPKVLDATDFTYRPSPPFAPGSHTYSIEIKDTAGNTVTDSGTFVTPGYTALTLANRVTSYDANASGFNFNLFVNQLIPPNSLAAAEAALAGEAVDEFGFPAENFADPAQVGVASGPGTLNGLYDLAKFQIPTVINLSHPGGGANGAFTPDDQIPGLPGQFNAEHGIAGEIITFVDLPQGIIKMGVTSTDGFRVQGGNVSSPALGTLLGESEMAGTTNFQFVVLHSGVYAFRTIFYETFNGASIEWFTLKPDGTSVLLNDVANGGYPAYRVGVIPGTGLGALTIQRVSGQTRVSWTDSGVVLQESVDLVNWTDHVGVTSPFQVVPAGRKAVFFRLKKQ